jgi:glycine dehydrogenase
MTEPTLDALFANDAFADRHVGIDADAERFMLNTISPGAPLVSRTALVEAIVPPSIARAEAMALPAPVGEDAALAELAAIAAQNRVLKSCIGQGYHGTVTPGVVLRNVLENPAWYTAYTPYQAEISQGRLEALINFQNHVAISPASGHRRLVELDEATAAAERWRSPCGVGPLEVGRFSRRRRAAADARRGCARAPRRSAVEVTVGLRTGRRAGAFAALAAVSGVGGAVRGLAPAIGAVHARAA